VVLVCCALETAMQATFCQRVSVNQLCCPEHLCASLMSEGRVHGTAAAAAVGVGDEKRQGWQHAYGFPEVG